MSNKKVAVFGLGYVGCVTAACLSEFGHQVIGVDINQSRNAMLNSGETPVSEPGLGDIVNRQVREGRLRATDNVKDAVENSDIALIAVGTPSLSDGAVCIDAVKAVVVSIADALAGTDRAYGIVNRSTLLPGVLENELRPILNASLTGTDGLVWIANNPEFLRESTAIKDYEEPPMVLVGADESWQAELVLELYEGITADRVVTDTRTAAMVKYACNAFHALKIAFANEIGTLAQSLGANGHDVMKLVCRDKKLNISPAYLRPGFAFGGSCLPKDVRALTRYAEQSANKVELLSSILPSNTNHLQEAVNRVQSMGQRQIGLIGLSFKANTDDLRESPQAILVETLLGRGYDVRIYDPEIAVSRLVGPNLAYVDQHLPHLAKLLVSEIEELCEHADLLVLGTDLAEKVDWSNCFDGPVVDLRRDLALPVQSVPEFA